MWRGFVLPQNLFYTLIMSREAKKFLIALIAFVALLGVGGAALYTIILVNQLPPLDQFAAREVSQSTKIYDRTGKVLLYELYGDEKRTVVPFDEIPTSVKDATLAAEDAEFYSQPAFDWKGIVRAVISDLKSGGAVEGGSTITQQLVKNVFLTPQKTIARKIQELVLAIKLEKQYSKDEILGAYLNQIPYGSNVYGVEEASQLYFGKSVQDDTLAEAATLAALPKAPTYYSPWGDHKDELLQRADYILGRMADLGFITRAEEQAALAEKVAFQPEPSLGDIRAPHFSLLVKQLLIDRFGEDVALRGGLKVITTLNWNLQQAAEQAVAAGAARNEELYGGNDAALVAQDPQNGQILALVGSRDYFDPGIDGKFDMPIQGLRQPGSALKPFVYLTAFEKGYNPKSLVFDTQTEFTAGDEQCPAIPTPTSDANKDCFHPVDFEGTFAGPVTFETALAQSINVPAVRVLYLVGLDDAFKTFQNFGITTLKSEDEWHYGLSVVLGGGEVHMIDLMNAYATLADDGTRHTQSYILRVEDSQGNVLYTPTDAPQQVAPVNMVRTVNQILSDVALRSGLFQASLGETVFPGHEVALKTGTSNDYRDAWTFGYTPDLVVGVWAGNSDNTPMHRQGSSILAAVPIWSNFMGQALTMVSSSDPFPRPDPLPLPSKPLLNGELVNVETVGTQTYPELHSELYWIDKSNPLGPAPENPYADPQFYNWEQSVKAWAEKNIPNFDTTYNKNPESSSFINADVGSQNISVNVTSPLNGSFVSPPLVIAANIQAMYGIKSVSLSFNGTTVDTKSAPGNTYQYAYLLSQPLLPQNILELTVTDGQGGVRKKTLIVFKQR